ncbi:MAG: energy-coupling factor ABC transporter permease [Bryobacteraceae bacterium]
MHIPDGLLSAPLWVGAAAASAVAVGTAARRAQQELDDSRVPLLGVMGAFVFAAQMVNFPLGFGTSGHLLGSVLLGATLGLAPAMVVMTAILFVQALVFQDGGILALGANIFNMAVAGTLAGYWPWSLWGSGRLRWAALAAGGLLSVAVSGALAVAELALSGVRIPGALAWTAAGLFLTNGVLEGLLTALIVRTLSALEPRAVRGVAASRRPAAVALGVAAIALAAGLVAVASEAPDVLDSLVERTGIHERARVFLATPLAGYKLAVLRDSWPAQAVAGLIGLGVIYLVASGLARAFRGRRSE